MAKKRKKSGTAAAKNAGNSSEVVIGTTRNFGKPRETEIDHELVAREAMEAALTSRFRAFNYVVGANKALLKRGYYELIVDETGKGEAESFSLLKRQAEKILSCNFQPPGTEREDLTWAEARWTPESGLDPHLPFTVGLCISRKPNAIRQAKTLAVVNTNTQLGKLSLVPNQKGDHLEIPGMGIMFTSNMVLVRRGVHKLGTCSFMEALQGTRREAWAKLLPEEEAEAARAVAEREFREAEQAKADAAADMFIQALQEAEREEAQRKLVRAQQRWSEEIASLPHTNEKWAEVIEPHNLRWSEAQDHVKMVMQLVRPGAPAASAVSRFTSLYGEAVKDFAEWIRSTYAKRERMKPHECVVMLREEVDGLVDEWFTPTGDTVGELKQLGAYKTFADLQDAVSAFPGIDEPILSMMVNFEHLLEEEGEEEEKATG